VNILDVELAKGVGDFIERFVFYMTVYFQLKNYFAWSQFFFIESLFNLYTI
jgi:hypothetical protein